MKKHYVEGSGNIYADLGVAHPQEARAKADLAHRIVDIIAGRKLTQAQAGKVLGVDQPKVSALMRGRLTDFSIERLLRFLGKLLSSRTCLRFANRPPFCRDRPKVVEAASCTSRIIPRQGWMPRKNLAIRPGRSVFT